ncbi:lasso peptide biosynthesis PqqD family chaperone [Streptomyces kronopolitis]|uniref:lasso peptide biosynthesis PqqD family chaperone n=1 Tax=Streptomyces kronopolitis TaxID=1612435 RepID=UPI0020C099E4|nr:lasso peptide biosynthesis PqqD family chaperone [Streptomyces kronopolitis]MCL6299762.1 lasso peptide biosynthesis PqqD family chaperone [Streptomyces kronopolitis]
MRLHPDVSMTDTDDGTVLLHQRTGRYWQLNATGSRVLHRLLDGDAPEAIADGLAAAHGIDPQQARTDVAAVVGQLRTAELTVAP